MKTWVRGGPRRPDRRWPGLPERPLRTARDLVGGSGHCGFGACPNTGCSYDRRLQGAAEPAGVTKRRQADGVDGEGPCVRAVVEIAAAHETTGEVGRWLAGTATDAAHVAA